MIEISRIGNDLAVTLKGGADTGSSTFTLRWSVGSEWASTLLMWHLRYRLHETIERTRRAAYEQGWKDAKSKKRAKQTWFSSRLEG